jgi:hypothetical protein
MSRGVAVSIATFVTAISVSGGFGIP